MATMHGASYFDSFKFSGVPSRSGRHHGHALFSQNEQPMPFLLLLVNNIWQDVKQTTVRQASLPSEPVNGPLQVKT